MGPIMTMLHSCILEAEVSSAFDYSLNLNIVSAALGVLEQENKLLHSTKDHVINMSFAGSKFKKSGDK